MTTNLSSPPPSAPTGGPWNIVHELLGRVPRRARGIRSYRRDPGPAALWRFGCSERGRKRRQASVRQLELSASCPQGSAARNFAPASNISLDGAAERAAPNGFAYKSR